MTVASVAASNTKKLMKFGLCLFHLGFKPSKCKTAAKMAVARIKLLRNKRQMVVKQMKRDIAMLLQSGQDATGRIRVEHVIREQNVLAANEFIELFCELIVARLTIITKQRECPADLKEGIASVIFAAPRCSEIPELAALRDVFEKKYGSDFVSAATDLRPNCGVNRMLIDKLSVRTPTGEVKLKVMKEIAKEYQIEWDTTESEKELLKPPEEHIEGPRTFVSASSLPVESAEPKKPAARSKSGREGMHFEDSASAAEAAAESAKKAIAAAEAAAYLVTKDTKQLTQVSSFDKNLNSSSINGGFGASSGYSPGTCVPNNTTFNSQSMNHQFRASGRAYEYQGSERSHYSGKEAMRPTHMEVRNVCRRHSYNNSTYPGRISDIKFDDSDCDEEIEMEQAPRSTHVASGKVCRRQSYNGPSAHSDIKFDESDYDEEIEAEEEEPNPNIPPPLRPPPPVPSSHVKQDPSHVHPKLPDYDALAARFEALKYRK